jgi:chemotaxis regulatin CheY-phosphate phosphatase CheZ
MPGERASELLYNTASSLRLVGAELDELAPRRAVESAAPAPIPVAQPVPAPASIDAVTAAGAVSSESGADGRALLMLPSLLEKAMGEVHSMLATLQNGRTRLQHATTDKLARTHEKLDEVTSATAHAALDIMDALDRAVGKVDELEQDALIADAAKSAAVRNELRDELFAVMGHMQFQDITSQQIMSVQAQLAEMEARLVEIAALFDPTTSAATEATLAPIASTASGELAYDPDATLMCATERQALVDSLVVRGPGDA